MFFNHNGLHVTNNCLQVQRIVTLQMCPHKLEAQKSTRTMKNNRQNYHRPILGFWLGGCTRKVGRTRILLHGVDGQLHLVRAVSHHLQPQASLVRTEASSGATPWIMCRSRGMCEVARQPAGVFKHGDPIMLTMIAQQPRLLQRASIAAGPPGLPRHSFHWLYRPQLHHDPVGQLFISFSKKRPKFSMSVLSKVGCTALQKDFGRWWTIRRN